MKTDIKLTVFFEGTFWVGVFERICGGTYEISRIVFGSEPRDHEVYDFVLSDFYNLRFNSSLTADRAEERKIDPKRLQREIRKEIENKGIGTKAQLALKMQYEENKVERRTVSRKINEERKERQYELRQEKKKEKHKGH